MKIVRFLLIIIVLSLAVDATAQQSSWKRVYTGEGYVIDLNVMSLEFGSDQILKAQIRTVLDKEEPIKDIPGGKSKSRVEQIEYKLRNGNYRITEVVLLDSGGKPLQTQNPNAAVWKPLKSGGMMERILLATRTASPFGKWKVASSRLAEGDKDKRPSEELSNFIGASVSLEAQQARVDQSVCGNPVYRSEHFTVTELSQRLGAEIKLPEVQSDRVDLIYVKCENDGWEPPESMLVKLPEGRMLMLWKGVFLTLKRT